MEPVVDNTSLFEQSYVINNKPEQNFSSRKIQHETQA